MKTRLFYFITALLTVSSIFSVQAETTEIVVCRSTTNSQVIHRAPAQIPITCFLEDDSILLVNFLDNLGSVSVKIENQTTGEYNQTIVNVLSGQIIFPISGTSGDWSITFTLTDGTIYQGFFNI